MSSELNKAGTHSNIKHIMLMAAGTGGHIFPALAVAEVLRAQKIKVSWLATPGGMEHKLVPAAGIPLYPIDIQGLRGNGVKRLLLAPVKIAHATFTAMRLFKTLKVDAVVGFGGYVSGPGGLAAWLLGIPLIVHEQNSIAGVSNKLLSLFARKVLEAFPHTFAPSTKVVTTGNPVRAEITAIAAPESRYSGRTGPIRILVVGGSLGAQALNLHVPQALGLLTEAITVTHQCGQTELEATQARYAAFAQLASQVSVVSFIHDMAGAYSDADLVICRAGALTVTELAMAGLPAVFIPLPTAVDDHQTYNAQFLCDAGAAKLCPQADLTAPHLAEILRPLLSREVLLTMANKARAHAILQSTQLVVAQILAV